VVISRAPAVYNYQARYRLANVLRLLRRNNEAHDLLESLNNDLPESAPLKKEVVRLIDRMQHDLGNEADYWKTKLSQAIKRQDIKLLNDSAGYLAGDQSEDGVDFMVGIYQSLSSDNFARSILLEYMAKSESLRVVEIIRQALNDSQDAVVSAAALAVGKMGDAESGNNLIKLLGKDNKRIRGSVVDGLGALRYVPATPYLIELGRDASNANIHENVCKALHSIGTGRSLEAELELCDKPDSKCGCLYSSWYRQVRREDIEPQLKFISPSSQPEGAVPRVGVVISSMTHHGPTSYGERFMMPYSRQIRKVWLLQRAGFETCLLADSEALEDPEAQELGTLLEPSVKLYGLGQWPACDVMIMDQLYHLPVAMIRTIHAFCKQGGKVLVCGAVGGGRCGDRVTLREILGIRKAHAHFFSNDTVALSWPDNHESIRLPVISRSDWAMRRKGSCFFHRIEGGEVLARFDSPETWAIKTHQVGKGKVMCLNWDVGFNLDGTYDENELFCRCLDTLLDKQAEPQSPGYRMMYYLRWGDLASAKGCIDSAGLTLLDKKKKIETLAQLYRIYLLENNGKEGQIACQRILMESGGDDSGRLDLERWARIPRRVQVASVLEEETLWWCDVPSWLPTVKGIPLWLAGPKDLPSIVHVRVRVPQDRSGLLRFYLDGSATICEIKQGSNELDIIEKDGFYGVAFGAMGKYNTWVELELEMKAWSVHLQAEVIPDA
jgi:hypothetical protein